MTTSRINLHPEPEVYDQVGRSISWLEDVCEKEKPQVLSQNSEWDHQQKSLILKSAPFVVGVTTFDVPVELSYDSSGVVFDGKQVFNGSGIIIECEAEATGDDGKFAATILTTSNLFTRINDVQPSDVQVDVYIPDGEAYKAELLCCDFHYNLAALRIQSDIPLQVAKLRDLNDILPFNTNDPVSTGRFQLHRHSDSFKICIGDLVAIVWVTLLPPSVPLGCADYSELDCKELYCLSVDHKNNRGGPVVNRHGEVIGIMVVDKYFLPCNVVSRWWKFFSKYRPRLIGLKFANLHRASVHFLEPFFEKFPTVSSGIIVTEVVESSPADQSGICARDVIVKCDSVPVRSTLELFETIWDKVGASVQLTILRLSSGDHIHLNMTVDEATKDNFYRWPVPESYPELYFEDEGSESEEMFESDSVEMTENME